MSHLRVVTDAWWLYPNGQVAIPLMALFVFVLGSVSTVGAKPKTKPKIKAVTNDGCITPACHTKLVAKKRFVHGPIGVGSCRHCHRTLVQGLAGPAHGKGMMEIPVASPKLCLPCHSQIEKDRKARFQHRPVTKTSCGYCHDPHGSAQRYLLRGDKPIAARKYCFRCHRDQRDFNRKVAHKPAIEGRCSRCHRAHGSGIRGLLRRSQAELCYECHQKAPWRKRKVQHGPVAAGSCSGCHQPHSADRAKLLKMPKEKLCLGCHQKSRVEKIHAVIAGANKKSCYDCHDVHASNKPFLVKERR